MDPQSHPSLESQDSLRVYEPGSILTSHFVDEGTEVQRCLGTHTTGWSEAMEELLPDI